MKKPLQLLIVEDNPADAKLLLAELRAAGFEPSWKRVETESDFLAELENSPDIILSDYSMPEFSGLRAVELLQSSGREIPFILISGTVGEDVAVEAMRRGATDYLLKDRIVRLGSAVERALRETQVFLERRQAEEALRTSEKEFRNLAEAMPQIVWVTRPDGWNIYFNQQWTDYTGLTLAESTGHGWNKPFHPDDQQRAWDAWQNATTMIGAYSIESRLRRADGTYRWWLIRGVPVQDDAGNILKWFGTCTDIHDLKLAELEITRANRALQMISACNEALVRAEGEQGLLESVCRIAVEIGGYRMAWVGYAQDDEIRSVKPMAHAGAEDGYLSAIKVSWNRNDPLGQGPAGQVIRTGRAMVCIDFSCDPTLAVWRAHAARHGFRSVTVLPLNEKGRTFGFLGLYSAELAEPCADEIGLLQELADDLAFGISHLRARLAQQRLQAAVLQVSAGVSGASGTKFFEHLACHMAEALGAHAGFVSQLCPGTPLSGCTLAAVVDGEVMAR